MSNILEEGAEYLLSEMKEHASKEIHILRGAKATCVKAVFGRTLLRVSDDFGGTRMEWTDRDFLIDVEDYRFDGRKTAPERGDLFRVKICNRIDTYEVMAPIGEPPWRYSDEHKKTFRIHTKLIRETFG